VVSILVPSLQCEAVDARDRPTGARRGEIRRDEGDSGIKGCAMTAELHPWPKVSGRPEVEPPKRLMRPCDWGLRNAINALETQLGTIEAYNRLATAAHELKAQIDAGQAKPQHPMFVTSTGAVE
jgi:hypothetical protein